MGAIRISKGVAAVIKMCWPDGVIEEFDTDESYFHDIRDELERDLRKISGASLRWQTEEESDTHWDADDEDEPPLDRDFQSYHVFFVSPHGKEFEFETETESVEEAEDPDVDELITTTVRGQGRYGCTVAISLAAPVAAVRLGDYAQFEDGCVFGPDPLSTAVSGETDEPVDIGEQCGQSLGEEALAKLENLRQKVAAVLAKHKVQLLDDSILDLPVPGLRAEEEVFVEGPPSIRDAFFFRGV